MFDVEMEERYLAIVLLDIIGSTAFVQKVGARKAASWFQYHDRLARGLCYKYDGREIDRSDGFLLSFETIVDAVNFALHYQKTVPPKTKLQTRIGIHWGKIIEVKQDDVFVGAGAKRVELEGLAKNIAARTMSLCMAGQVLLTSEAMDKARGRMNRMTPKDTRYVCVGLYQFKGVSTPQSVFAVGETIESLQPPKGSEKVKRLGGPKYIKQRARDRKIKDWIDYFIWRLGIISLLIVLYVLFLIISSPVARMHFLGLPYSMPILDGTLRFISDLWQSLVDTFASKR